MHLPSSLELGLNELSLEERTNTFESTVFLFVVYSRSVTPVQSTPGPSRSSSKPIPADMKCRSALLAKMELLESEHSKPFNKKHYFHIEDIQDSDTLISFYTGFVSYNYGTKCEFLGPVVNELTYWGSKSEGYQRRLSMKVNPKNQFFLVLVKLRLNLMLKDLAYRFGLSTFQTSRYLTTWICFLYQTMKEIEWMPTVSQVMGTLPIQHFVSGFLQHMRL